MLRFMKNGEVHVALTRVTEWLEIGKDHFELCTFIMSQREEEAGKDAHFGVDWTPLAFIEWLPSAIPVFRQEWITAMRDEG